MSEEEIVRAIRDGARTVSEVRRRTRAGMGMCQGKTCSRLVAGIISRETGLPIEEVLEERRRPPVRPLSFAQLRSINRATPGNPLVSPDRSQL